MGSLGFGEIVALAVLALMIFGPDRLPGIAKQVGTTVARFRQEANKTLGELRDAAGVDDDVATLAREAKEISANLRDVKKSATGALMSGLDAVNEAGEGEKPQSAGGPTPVVAAVASFTPGDAPYDPDAT